jgi:polyhydroxyalkanoate synthase
MATEDMETPEVVTKMQDNLKKVDELSQRLIRVLQNKKSVNPALNGPGNDLFLKASTNYWQSMMTNPNKLFETQVQYWTQSVTHFMEAQQALVSGQSSTDSGAKDRRFSNPMWDENPYFNYLKRQYLANSQALNDAVADLEGLDAKEQRRLVYFAQQITDMMSPTNFLGTNPDALQKAVETEGQSLISGLENLISDLEANDGELVVKLADESAFEIGENVATAKGKVVYRNRMMELIQYSPSTDEVHETPLIVFPPWINKFYILDLREQNSFIRWVTDQGYTLFVVSWVNPDASYADTGLEDYINDGYLAAVETVKEICDVKQVNVVGYCIAGTTLSMTLSLMKKRKDKSIKSATFFTALTDFSDQGEFTPFLQNDFIDGIEDEVKEKGVLESFIMARTFSYLRSNDLVYGPAIKSYMMGEAPPAFDLLFWNGDGANLPAKMVVQYLRGLCQGNEFTTDGFELMDETLHISDVDIPLCSIACETDHIAAWKDCYRGVQLMGSKNKTFIMTQSGHIAGIVNPPNKDKYGHYTNNDLSLDSEDWAEGADFHKGSWWPRWEAWLAERSGEMIPARIPGESTHKAICDAPGTYVAVRAKV